MLLLLEVMSTVVPSLCITLTVSGEGSSGVRRCTCAHTCPPWSRARFVCCNSAVAAGDMAFMDVALVLTILSFLANSTLLSVLVWSYSTTTYDYSTDMQFSLKLYRFVDKVETNGVTSSIPFQMSNATFFTPACNDDTAWSMAKAGNGRFVLCSTKSP